MEVLVIILHVNELAEEQVIMMGRLVAVILVVLLLVAVCVLPQKPQFSWQMDLKKQSRMYPKETGLLHLMDLEKFNLVWL
ncbi:hypothetical protein [Kiloniella sp. b19]|uniref:hypothetical protein n=1 Tax=Kiloniella sp. GXU_MW_B19 TaxID=3141326 RepID=UPI0031D36105